MQTPTQTYQDRRDSERAVLLVPSAISTFGADGGGGDASATPDESRHATRSGREWHEVPWRTIVATIVLVVASIMLIRVVYIASDMIMLLLVAGFFAIVLNRPVRALQRRFTIARGLAIGVVVGATVTIVLGLITVFVLPVRTQLVAVLTDLPGTAEQASRGTGPIGNLTSKLHLVSLARDHQAAITKAAESIENSLPSMLSSLLGALLKSVTVIVLVCLMLTQSATLSSAVVQVVPVRYRTRVTDTAEDAAASVSGYMIGNLLISMFAGLAALVVLLVLGVPNAIVISLFVAFADLLPLIGATIGAVVAVIAAFTVSSTAGIIALVFFVLYQQFENSVLQVMVDSSRRRIERDSFVSVAASPASRRRITPRHRRTATRPTTSRSTINRSHRGAPLGFAALLTAQRRCPTVIDLGVNERDSQPRLVHLDVRGVHSGQTETQDVQTNSEGNDGRSSDC